jgi:hypothetical protein
MVEDDRLYGLVCIPGSWLAWRYRTHWEAIGWGDSRHEVAKRFPGTQVRRYGSGPPPEPIGTRQQQPRPAALARQARERLEAPPAGSRPPALTRSPRYWGV